jgi:aminopeptidase YwaD
MRFMLSSVQMWRRLCALLFFAALLTAQDHRTCSPCLQGHIEFLASDALRGRGSATRDEHIAALYIASQLKQYGIKPVFTHGEYLQVVPLTESRAAKAPTMTIVASGNSLQWTHGREFLILQGGAASFRGVLQKLKAADGDRPRSGAVVLLEPAEGEEPQQSFQRAMHMLESGARAVLVRASPGVQRRWEELARELPEVRTEVTRATGKANGSKARPLAEGIRIALRHEAFQALEKVADGTAVTLHTEIAEERKQTWNVVGLLEGARKNESVLLSAHYDHVGIGPKVGGDEIYNGADDDASGVAAVLDLARLLASGARPSRSVVFAFFGSEEKGGLGSGYFLDHSPVPLQQIIANLQLEMLGRPDPKVPGRTVWLTGFDRSDLGAALARHGARLVADPHPEQQFFQRSDNYQLAKRGVVAHTVSSFGLHPDYHRPTDEVSKIDFEHMTAVTDSLRRAVEWLINSDFKPRWSPGKKP